MNLYDSPKARGNGNIPSLNVSQIHAQVSAGTPYEKQSNQFSLFLNETSVGDGMNQGYHDSYLSPKQ